MPEIVVQAEPFDMGDASTAFAARQENAGAVVSFSGIVRDVATPAVCRRWRSSISPA